MFFFVVVSEANIYNILLVENEFSVHCCVIYDVYQIFEKHLSPRSSTCTIAVWTSVPEGRVS